MKKNWNKWVSVVESLVFIRLVTIWVISLLQLYNTSVKISLTTWNKILAIWMASEWIEAMTNIRDTNWKLWPLAHYECWNTMNYNADCLDPTKVNSGQIQSWSYVITNSWTTNRWILIKRDNPDWDKYEDPVNSTTLENRYITKYYMRYDNNWFYSQVWPDTTFKVKYTREIQISYNHTWSMNVTSLVQWIDRSSKKPKKVELSTILTNWAE